MEQYSLIFLWFDLFSVMLFGGTERGFVFLDNAHQSSRSHITVALGTSLEPLTVKVREPKQATN